MASTSIMDCVEELNKQLIEIADPGFQGSVSPLLHSYLIYVAKTGYSFIQWTQIRKLVKLKIYENLTRMQPPIWDNDPKFDVEKSTIALYARVDYLNNAPFTFQRLCELLTDPGRHYHRINVYIRALEKCLYVQNM